MSKVITIDDLSTNMVGKALDLGVGQQVVDGINRWIENYTTRCFGETKQLVERYDWANSLYLRHQDVVTVDQIRLGYPGQTQSVLDPTGYWVNPSGRLTLLGQSLSSNGRSRWLNDYMEITYTYGLQTVPDDLFVAALGIAAGFYNWATNGNRDVASVSAGSYHVEYTNRRQSSDSKPDAATSTADANWQVIDSYRTRHV